MCRCAWDVKIFPAVRKRFYFVQIPAVEMALLRCAKGPRWWKVYISLNKLLDSPGVRFSMETWKKDRIKEDDLTQENMFIDFLFSLKYSQSELEKWLIKVCVILLYRTQIVRVIIFFFLLCSPSVSWKVARDQLTNLAKFKFTGMERGQRDIYVFLY